MRIPKKRSVILILIIACAASSIQGGAPPLTLKLSTEKNIVKAGSEVKVDITLVNSSNRAMYMSFGLSEIDYMVDVRDGKGDLAPGTDYAQKRRERPYYSSDTVFTLKPGESLPKATLSVTKLYDLSSPGEYTIRVSRAVPKELGGGTVKSNKITVTITP